MDTSDLDTTDLVTTVDTRHEPGRIRLAAVRVVAAAFLAIGLAGINLVLVLPFLSWLSGDRLVTLLGYPAEDLHHRQHAVGIGLLYGSLLLCVALQVRRPGRWVAPLWLISFIMVAQILYDLVMWDIGDPIWLVVYALFAALVVLHPRRTAPVTAVNRPAMLLGAAAAIPLAGYGWGQLQLQLGPEDPFGHAADNHYFAMAALAAVIIVSASLGSTDAIGSRPVAWIAGATAVLFATGSLAHAGMASAWPRWWAVSAVVWSVAYLAAVERRRSESPAAGGWHRGGRKDIVRHQVQS